MHGLRKTNFGNIECLSATIVTEIVTILEIEWPFGLKIRREIFRRATAGKPPWPESLVTHSRHVQARYSSMFPVLHSWGPPCGLLKGQRRIL